MWVTTNKTSFGEKPIKSRSTEVCSETAKSTAVNQENSYLQIISSWHDTVKLYWINARQEFPERAKAFKSCVAFKMRCGREDNLKKIQSEWKFLLRKVVKSVKSRTFPKKVSDLNSPQQLNSLIHKHPVTNQKMLYDATRGMWRDGRVEGCRWCWRSANDVAQHRCGCGSWTWWPWWCTKCDNMVMW